MKNVYLKLSLVSLLVIISWSCETDFENPNQATDEQTYSSREGIFAASIGMQQLYSTSVLRWNIETPAITTREAGITTTFQNMIELEDGGNSLPNFNANISGLWSTNLRIMKISEELQTNIPSLDLAPGTQSGLLAFSKLFKAMAIGNLAQNYEQVIVETDQNSNANFVSRAEGYEFAIDQLTEALSLLNANPVSDEFTSEITAGNIDLSNSIQAMIARYSLFSGDYETAISAANNVDQSSISLFRYDAINLNPIWSRVYLNNTPNFKPRDNFGLPEEFVFDEQDGRIDFYLIPLDETNQNGLPIEDLAGFFDENTESIPLYIPDEMNLIIAEANLRKDSPDIDAAINALDRVRTDSDDPLGINANLAPYSGSNEISEILMEIYKNRRAELFLTGLSLEDSRRFNRPEPSLSVGNYDEERNRNFYPYPERERNSNPNTPTDPQI
ncbi:RagB/SusD family nutrient uptake outer membrane protein [Salegentibacter sp. Hel_I_6]|uniref:RagB/SusD family nutrient uptake outer membrane protein n=1 Tax=Salegentibacter sp. Hel_I_6 TaxID=1250278 RepID=UPI00055A2A18|nr:RagB/SusD family nutrient uptake outer membrane protein [Salegentibacter sp. Hel_I_6]